MPHPALATLASALLLASPAAKMGKALPGASSARQVREDRLAKGLLSQRERVGQVRARPESFNLRTDKPGVHFLFDAAGNCATEERLGALGDGGKWVCNARLLAGLERCVVYGVGAGSEISFEEAMAALGCEVHLFDPSEHAVQRFGALAKAKKIGAGSVTFHPWGLGPVSREAAKAMQLELDGKPVEVRTLDALTRALGHERVDLLKVDIEGSEWAALDDLFQKDLLARLGIKVLLAELHVGWSSTPKDLVDLIDGLAARGFVLYRKELNPWDPGCCAEYAFAQKAFLLE